MEVLLAVVLMAIQNEAKFSLMGPGAAGIDEIHRSQVGRSIACVTSFSRQAGCSHSWTVFLSSSPGHLVASESKVLKWFNVTRRVTLLSTGSFLNGRESVTNDTV